MQTRLLPELTETRAGAEAQEILRSCVHCGFCNATCPTYQLLGDERDGPRGRIYLIKQMLEEGKATRETQRHLDRCLSCRACETTCPSDVAYARLLDIGRSVMEKQVSRPLYDRWQRAMILWALPHPGRLRSLLRLLKPIRPMLPARMRKSLPQQESGPAQWPVHKHDRAVLLLQGCVQSVIAPRINLAAAKVLDRLEIEARPGEGCCAALSMHLSQQERTMATIRNNIDAWWPEIESGVEAIVLTASGCAPMVADYGHLLRDDPDYADKADRIASMSMDISEFLLQQDLALLSPPSGTDSNIVFHAPCTLQHALGGAGRVEGMLTGLGFTLAPVEDSHLCCGSAGSYSLLQKDLSGELLRNKLRCLEKDQPSLIATANIGCLSHLQSGTERPVMHWIELLA